MIRVEIPIACCSGCWRPYTLDEWRDLEVAEPTEGQPAELERRRCSTCGVTMAFNFDGFDDLDLTMDADLYEQQHPSSPLPDLARARYAAELVEQRRRRRWRTVAFVAIAAATAAAVALLGWLAR